MIKTNISITVLEASNGYWLTQTEDVSPEERMFARKLYLSKLDSPENWKEVTDSEKDKIQNKLTENQ